MLLSLHSGRRQLGDSRPAVTKVRLDYTRPVLLPGDRTGSPATYRLMAQCGQVKGSSPETGHGHSERISTSGL